MNDHKRPPGSFRQSVGLSTSLRCSGEERLVVLAGRGGQLLEEGCNDEYVDEHDEDFYDNYDDSIDEMPMAKCIQAPMRADAMMPRKREMSSATGKSLREYMKQMDRSFQEMRFDLIDESGMTDVEC